MILWSHPTGTQSSRALLAEFARRGALTAGMTSLVVPSWLPSLLPAGLAKEARRRQFPEAAGQVIATQPVVECARTLLQRTRLASWVQDDARGCSTYALYQGHDRRAAAWLRGRSDVRLVYAYDDGAEETFKVARQKGVTTAYECPTAHWRTWSALYAEEAERTPAWADTLPQPLITPEKSRRKDAEFALADVVFCASRFAARSLAEHLPASVKLEITPYGAPAPAAVPAILGGGPRLRVLYVGRLSQTKGLSYLMEAIAGLGAEVTLTTVGLPTHPGSRAVAELVNRSSWVPSLPHAELLACMRNHDVLVLPSLSEGFGLVILEAMAQGLPVIATENSGGPDVITSGVDGWVVPIRSAEAISEALLGLQRDRERLRAMGQAAWKTASGRTWDRYGRGVWKALEAGRSVNSERKT